MQCTRLAYSLRNRLGWPATLLATLSAFSLNLAGCPSADTAADLVEQAGREGPAGPAGATGAAGQDGAQGPQGPEGPAGATGQDGAQGLQGPAGATGATGASGPAGQNGAQGPQGPAGTNGTDGTDGTNGSDGTDGQLIIYGNGADGARTIGSDTDISNEPISHQYTDFTVNAGQTLSVPSGTTIRCTGSFTNHGTIVVSTGSFGGQSIGLSASAESGLARRSPTTAANGQAQSGVVAGVEGRGSISTFLARWNLEPGFYGGGGGAASGAANGGGGGGTLVILAQAAVVNSATGVIVADGQSFQSGGGAGGVVILASRAGVTNAGVVNARGGAGQDAADLGGGLTFVSACGGGGGGIVRILSPANTLNGTVSVAGGASGAALLEQLTVTTATVLGGGGGGACFGDGGNGGASSFVVDVLPIGSVNLLAPTLPAQDGFFEATIIDPTALF
jgi:hypothetical protein